MGGYTITNPWAKRYITNMSWAVTCTATQYETTAGCAACANTACAGDTFRAGSCTTKTQGFVCSKQPVCPRLQYLNRTSPLVKGTCMSCTNAICPSKDSYHTGLCNFTTNALTCNPCTNAVCTGFGEYRGGECGGTNGTVDGYTCLQQPTCIIGEFLKGATDTTRGTCTACANVQCPANKYRVGLCTSLSEGFFCTDCANAQCGAGTFREGACNGAYMCKDQRHYRGAPSMVVLANTTSQAHCELACDATLGCGGFVYVRADKVCKLKPGHVHPVATLPGVSTGKVSCTRSYGNRVKQAIAGQITAPFERSGAFVQAPKGAGYKGPGQLDLRVVVQRPSLVKLAAVVYDNGPSVDSVYVWFDGEDGNKQDWNFNAKKGLGRFEFATAWNLTAGNHTLHLGNREDGTRLQAVEIVSGDATFDLPPTSGFRCSVQPVCPDGQVLLGGAPLQKGVCVTSCGEGAYVSQLATPVLPAAAPAALSTTAASATTAPGSAAYVLGAQGSRVCMNEPGTLPLPIITQGECNAAAHATLRAIGKLAARPMQVGAWSWSWVPPGCSVQSGGGWAPHFNTNTKYHAPITADAKYDKGTTKAPDTKSSYMPVCRATSSGVTMQRSGKGIYCGTSRRTNTTVGVLKVFNVTGTTVAAAAVARSTCETFCRVHPLCSACTPHCTPYPSCVWHAVRFCGQAETFAGFAEGDTVYKREPEAYFCARDAAPVDDGTGATESNITSLSRCKTLCSASASCVLLTFSDVTQKCTMMNKLDGRTGSADVSKKQITCRRVFSTGISSQSPDVSNFATRAAMEGAGWVFSSSSTYMHRNEKTTTYCETVKRESYCGFEAARSNGTISLVLATKTATGYLTADFGNAWSGVVTLSINGVQKASAHGSTLSTVATLPFRAGDVLQFKDACEGDLCAVIVLNRLQVWQGAQPTTGVCGMLAGVGAFSDRLQMQAAGWVFSSTSASMFRVASNDKYCSKVPKASYCGYDSGGKTKPIRDPSSISLTLATSALSGDVTLDFGAASGTANVYINNVKLATTTMLSNSQTFAFQSGDVLKLDAIGVMVLNTIAVECSTSAGDVTWFNRADAAAAPLDWDELFAKCTSKGLRLCTVPELCPDGAGYSPVGGVQSGGDDWCPASDESLGSACTDKGGAYCPLGEACVCRGDCLGNWGPSNTLSNDAYCSGGGARITGARQFIQCGTGGTMHHRPCAKLTDHIRPDVVPVVDTGASGCTPSAQCSVCQGDCDDDNDCANGLKCFQRQTSSQTVPGCAATGPSISNYVTWVVRAPYVLYGVKYIDRVSLGKKGVRCHRPVNLKFVHYAPLF